MKRTVQGAPICEDEAGKTVPCPAPAPARDGVEGIARLAVQTKAAQQQAASPPPPASHHFVFKLGLNFGLTAFFFAALLVALRLKLKFASADFEFEKDPRGPGEVARGFLKTQERPESVKAVLELYRDENDVPDKTLPADVGVPERLPEGGWRTAVSVTLPPDVDPPFAGGWALSIEGTANGKKFLAGDNPNLKPKA